MQSFASSRYLVILALLSLGCRSWVQQDLPPDVAIARAKTGPIRVTKTDHSVVQLAHASILRDSLIGAPSDDSSARVAIPLSGIQSIATREVSSGRTAGFGLGVILGVVAVTGILAAVAIGQLAGGI